MDDLPHILAKAFFFYVLPNTSMVDEIVAHRFLGVQIQ
jgi:hypothetical protein